MPILTLYKPLDASTLNLDYKIDITHFIRKWIAVYSIN
jgi:hypothetical protein